jgi:hypothetical protein
LTLSDRGSQIIVAEQQVTETLGAILVWKLATGGRDQRKSGVVAAREPPSTALWSMSLVKSPESRRFPELCIY